MSESENVAAVKERFRKAELALECVLERSDIGKVTVRQYLKLLLKTLWEEAEGFSSKRPFGNSGWQCDVAVPLIKAGIIPGKLDEDDCIEHYDSDDLDLVIQDAIDAIFSC